MDIKAAKKELDILIIDSNPLSLEENVKKVKDSGFTVMSASQLPFAMEMLIYYNPKVVLTELKKNEEESLEFLRALRRIRTGAVIIIFSDQATTDYSAYQKKLGLVFEVLEKKTPQPILQFTLDRAIQFYKQKQDVMANTSTDSDRMKERLEWMLWKQQKMMNSKNAFGKTIIETIVHSIFQGMGVGSLVSLLDLMEMTMESREEEVVVNKGVVQSILDNVRPVRIIKERLDNIIHIYDKNYSVERMDGAIVRSHIFNALEQVDNLTHIKNNQVIIDDINIPIPILGNADLLELAIRELLTNAFKYSPENSTINISKAVSPEGLAVVVMNDVMDVTRGIAGVPPELENEIFEPFFKINNVYDERFFEEELGLGIGLSYIQYAMSSIGGKVFVHEIMDHVSMPIKRKVLAELIFKVAE